MGEKGGEGEKRVGWGREKDVVKREVEVSGSLHVYALHIELCTL